MAVQYWVGDFLVDVSRNQLTRNDQSQIIAPKVLAVLTLLAKNQGRVVAYDELFASVWLDTVVTPNTLQRSVALLRKVLDQDSAGESYIKTHAKQGYSLEREVEWLADYDSADRIDQKENSITMDDSNSVKQTSSSQVVSVSSIFMLIIAGLLILGGAGSYYFGQDQLLHLSFDSVRSITATDDKEFDATYTPDGKYIVFHRYLDNQCGNKLWAKNVETQKETLLTKNWGAYGTHSFSQDGSKLVFIETQACKQPVTQRDCYDLVSLDFTKALESPQSPDVVLNCKNSRVKNPAWLNNGEVALFQRKANRWKLISYSMDEKSSRDLYNLTDGNLVDFAYSARDNLIAVISIHENDQHYLEMLNVDGKILSSNPIVRPPELSSYREIYPSFDPINRQLIFSTGKQLFTLSYDGQVAKIDIPFIDMMVRPEFHPNGEKLLMIKAPYDNDVVLMTRDPASQTLIEQSEEGSVSEYRSIERTNLGEKSAVFQPGGKSIAFWSTRSGEEQIWIIDDNGGARQLTYFPMDTRIRGFVWSADGKSLLVNANNVLSQVFLDKTQKVFPLRHSVVLLMQWNSEMNTSVGSGNQGHLRRSLSRVLKGKTPKLKSSRSKVILCTRLTLKTRYGHMILILKRITL